MRFLADGPDIPDELLDARDEGQVIFFCGAGVSQHEAGGPNFHELAAKVVEALGSARGSPARQLLEFAQNVQPIAGVGGMMPADRIFGLLEQEFPAIEVRRAVAGAICPKIDPGLGAHRSLIDLSRTPDGTVRLVTTNFDRVFELAQPGIRTVAPPMLPDPSRPGLLEGVIHMHGKVSTDYVGPESDEFVLSSADFGRAYLADGWATDFIRGLMDRYRIVFVGYSADDPPMQYLLEALQPNAVPGRLYAFQSGEASLAAGLWQHKGVTAIPFKGFQNLWNTLNAWAERARDPDGWRWRIASMATGGPRDLLPHERGQVAHLVSSAVGADVFARHEPVPPADWVCVFDPHVRYDRRRPINVWDGEAGEFDPYDAYGLDSDPPPRRPADDETMSERREVPEGSWSALAAIGTDEPSGRRPAFQSIRGPRSNLPPEPPKRLLRIARWFGRVATDRVAVWWAAGQNGLHPELLQQAQWAVLQEGVDANVRNAWRCIATAMLEPLGNSRDPWLLHHAIGFEGWSTLALQRLVAIERARLTVSRPSTSPISTPEESRTILYLDVAYSEHLDELDPPDVYLADYVEGTRQNLLVATRLEEMTGEYALMNLQPLHPYELEPNEFVGSNPNLSTLTAHLSRLVSRLHELAPEAARGHVASWRDDHGIPFRLLRIWAAADPQLTDAPEASRIILDAALQDWDGPYERDMLAAIKARWDDLPLDDRTRLEQLLVAGPQNLDEYEPKQFETYRNRSVLRRLFWLQRQNIPVSFDLGGEIRRLHALTSDWKPEAAADQLDHSPNRGGNVRTDKSQDVLAGVSLGELLDVAMASSGPGRNFLVENRPFRGLVETQPNRALAALHRAAQLGEPWSWAWNDLLWSDARAKDSPRFNCLIARRLAQLPDAVLAESISSATHWFFQNSKAIWVCDRTLYRGTWQLLADAAARHPEKAASSIVRSTRKDWLMSAINSPPGRLTDMVFREVGWAADGEDPIKLHVARLTALMELPGTLACLAVSRMTMHLNWLYEVADEWTVLFLLAKLRGSEDRHMQDAAVAGLLRQRALPQYELFALLKPILLGRLEDPDLADEQQDGIAQIILHGWLESEDGQRWVSSEDLRNLLIHSNEGVRLRCLRSLTDWGERSEEVAAQVPEFLTRVWPRQLAVRTPAASAALADLALHSGQSMPRVTQAIMPLVETTAVHVEALPRFRRADDEILKRFPREHLEIFFAILPEDVALWPWGMDQMIESFTTMPDLKSDPKLAELRRRLARA